MSSVVLNGQITNVFSSDQSQVSNGLIGTVASLFTSTTARFSDAEPSDGLIGTTATLSTSTNVVFREEGVSDGSVGTTATLSTSTNVVFLDAEPSDALIGTTGTLSASTNVIFAEEGVSDGIVGTTAILDGKSTSLFEAFVPKIFSKDNMTNESKEYNALAATLLMASSTTGNVNNKARFVIDLGANRRVAKIIMVSGESSSNGNQKLKQVNIYKANTAYTVNNAEFNDFNNRLAGKVGTINWSSPTSAIEQEVNLIESRK